MQFERSILYYPEFDVEQQVKLQIALARRYARDYLDAALSKKELIEEISFALYIDMKKNEAEEKYEYCMLYKDTIENIEFISIEQLY